MSPPAHDPEDRWDVIVVGLRQGAESRQSQLIEQLQALTRMPEAHVRTCLRRGEVIAQRGIPEAAARRVAAALERLGGSVEVAESEDSIEMPILERDPEMDREESSWVGGVPAPERDPKVPPPPTVGVSPLAPPPAFGGSDRRPEAQPTRDAASPPAVSAGAAPSGPPSVGVGGPGGYAGPPPAAPPYGGTPVPYPTGSYPAVPVMHPGGYPPAGAYPPMMPGAYPPPGVYPPAPMPMPVPTPAPARPLGADLADRLDAISLDDADDAVLTLDGHPGATVDAERDRSEAEAKAKTKDTDRKKKPKKKTTTSTRRIAEDDDPEEDAPEPRATLDHDDDIVVDYAAAGLSTAEPEPEPNKPTMGGKSLALDRSATPSEAPPAAAADPASSHSGSAAMSGADLSMSGAATHAGASMSMRSPAPDLFAGPRLLFGRDGPAAMMWGLAAGAAVALLIAVAVTRLSGSGDIGTLEAELADAFAQPLSVEQGELRAPSVIKGELSDIHDSMRRRFLLVLVLVGGPLGYFLGRMRLDRS